LLLHKRHFRHPWRSYVTDAWIPKACAYAYGVGSTQSMRLRLWGRLYPTHSLVLMGQALRRSDDVQDKLRPTCLRSQVGAEIGHDFVYIARQNYPPEFSCLII
jgi:hypothetical protein